MKELYLTDEEIYGKEPSFEEQGLIEENKKLKIKLVNVEDELEISQYTIENISNIVKAAITDNIRKTRLVSNPNFVKKYREELLILRALEKEIKDYNNRLVKLLS